MGPAGGFEGEERRLHPATLALAVVRLGPQSLNMLPALAAIGITGNWRWVAPAILLFIIVSLAISFIGWLRFTWRVDADDIAITSGVISRNHRTIPFDRIQDVNIEQGLLARALGLAKVTLETGAGDGEGEGALDSIAFEEATALRDHIRAHRTARPAAALPTEGITPLPAARVLLTMTPGRLLLAGLFNFSLAIIAVLFGVLQTFDDVLPFDPFSPELWIELANRFGVEQWVMAHQWLAAVGGLVLLLLLGMTTGIVRMVTANWGFRLERTERGFRRTRGLTTRTDVVIPAARVQGAIVSGGIIARRLGWHSLALQSLASDGANEADHLVAPFARLQEIDAILAELGLDRAGLEEAPLRRDDVWQGVHPVAATGGLVFAALFLLAGVLGVPQSAAAWAAGDGAPDLGWMAIVALAVGVGIAATAIVGWRMHAWTYDGRVLHIVRGVLTRQHDIVPARNVQSADLSFGPVTRRFGLAALTLGVPGGRAGQHHVPALPRPLVTMLRAQLLAVRG